MPWSSCPVQIPQILCPKQTEEKYPPATIRSILSGLNRIMKHHSLYLTRVTQDLRMTLDTVTSELHRDGIGVSKGIVQGEAMRAPNLFRYLCSEEICSAWYAGATFPTWCSWVFRRCITEFILKNNQHRFKDINSVNKTDSVCSTWLTSMCCWFSKLCNRLECSTWSDRHHGVPTKVISDISGLKALIKGHLQNSRRKQGEHLLWKCFCKCLEGKCGWLCPPSSSCREAPRVYQQFSNVSNCTLILFLMYDSYFMHKHALFSQECSIFLW